MMIQNEINIEMQLLDLVEVNMDKQAFSIGIIDAILIVITIITMLSLSDRIKNKNKTNTENLLI